MNARIRINPIVEVDLREIKEYLAQDDEEIAVRIIREIYGAIEQLSYFP
ncbi:MAG: hypothetical protein ACRCWQ_07950 [Bacilli bacterium]